MSRMEQLEFNGIYRKGVQNTMGQRSQIYILWDINTTNKYNKEPEHYEGFIARYFQWNYGERMVSRARGLVEQIKDGYLRYPYKFNGGWDRENMIHIAETNFDMRDKVASLGIVQEHEEYASEEPFSDVFDVQDNNDGQLYLYITEKGVKYGFIWPGETKVKNASGYLDADICGCENSEKPKETWIQHMYKSKYYDNDTIKYTLDNIEYLKKNAKILSSKELQAFRVRAEEIVSKNKTDSRMA